MADKKVIGVDVRQKDGNPRVTGEAKYYGDFQFRGMLEARILRSPHPAADIVSIDTGAAEAMEGVHLVMTHENFPKAFRKTVYYVGDLVAAVIAVDDTVAEEAMAAIKVEYKTKPFVMDLDEAIKPDSPQVFEGEANCHDWEHHAFLSDRDPETGLYKTKTPAEYNGFGDLEKGFAEADVIVEQKGFRYAMCKSPAIGAARVARPGTTASSCTSTPTPRGCMTRNIAWPRPWASARTKSTWSRRSPAPASAARTPRCSTPKSAFPLPAHPPGLACLHLKRPVHCGYSREEEMLCGCGPGAA